MYQQVDKDMVAVLSFVDQAGELFEVDIKEELAFSEHTLNQATFTHASKYVWWTEILSHAKRHLDSANTAMDLLEAQLGNQARDVIGQTGTKPTKDAVHDYVVTQQAYIDGKANLDWWANRVFQLQYIVKAWEQRGSALIQAGAQYRKEMDSYNIK